MEDAVIITHSVEEFMRVVFEIACKRSVVSVGDADSTVYVRNDRWRRYTADGRFSKLTGSG